jgi:Enoyl-(Acyl carrier protein) reductase
MAARNGQADAIAKELTPRGIRVNTISPGPIVTPILDKGGLTPAQKDNFIEGAKTRIPLGRTGTAAEVATAALYLAADATYTTGFANEHAGKRGCDYGKQFRAISAPKNTFVIHARRPRWQRDLGGGLASLKLGPASCCKCVKS